MLWTVKICVCIHIHACMTVHNIYTHACVHTNIFSRGAHDGRAAVEVNACVYRSLLSVYRSLLTAELQWKLMRVYTQVCICICIYVPMFVYVWCVYTYMCTYVADGQAAGGS